MASETDRRIGRVKIMFILAPVIGIVAVALAAFFVPGGPEDARPITGAGKAPSLASLKDLYNGGEFKAALPKLVLYVEEKPDDIEARTMLASSYWLSGMTSEARKAYEALLEIAPEDADTWYRLGILHGQQGSVEAATRHLERAIKLRPDSALFHSELAKNYVREAAYQKAVAGWKRALSRYDNPRARANVFAELGDTYVLMNDKAVARQAYEDGLNEQKDHGYLKQRLDQL